MEEIVKIPICHMQFTKAGLRQSQSQPSRRQAIEKQSKNGEPREVGALLSRCDSYVLSIDGALKWLNAWQVAPGTEPLFSTFEEALAATKAIQRAPSVKGAESGNDFYSVQPQQLISWYPR